MKAQPAAPLNNRRVLHSGDAPRLLAVAAYRFPHGDAMSNRLLNLIRSTQPAARPLIVNTWPDSENPDPIALASIGDVELVYLRPLSYGRTGRLLERAIRPFQVVKTARARNLGRHSLTAILLPQGLVSLTTLVVLRLGFSCPIVVDVTERHDPEQFPAGRWAPYYLRHRWSAALTNRFADKVTAVSSRLADHFRRGSRDVLVLPPQVDCHEFEPAGPPPITQRVRLLYAGTPGGKDLLNDLLAAMASLPHYQQQRLELLVAGVTREQALASTDIAGNTLAAVEANVTFLGRVPRQQVKSLLRESHFSILFRLPGGYADAGFPSKVPESLAAGCPIFLNATSDLSLYLTDGAEAILVDRPTAEAIAEGLARILEVSDDGWIAMSRAARQRAERSFDYRVFPQARRIHSRSVDAAGD